MSRPFFAAPHADQKPPKRARARHPLNFVFLTSGGFGDVYLSPNLTTVIKLPLPKPVHPRRKACSDEEEAIADESRMLDYLGRRAPDYVPVPCALIRVHDQTLGIQMPNVGPALCDVLPWMAPDEIALCILQSIHFVLLLGDRVRMEDVHHGNVCVQLAQEDIRLRFIDVAMWERCDADRTCWIDVVVRNAQKLFLDEGEGEEDNGMWREVLSECGPGAGYAALLAALSRTFVVGSGASIFDILLRVARAVLEFLGGRSARAHVLVQQIAEAAVAARAALRPSRRPSVFARPWRPAR
jgi:hypothetical protein